MRYLLTTASELTDELQTELAEVTEHISRTQEYLDRYLPAVISSVFGWCWRWWSSLWEAG